MNSDEFILEVPEELRMRRKQRRKDDIINSTEERGYIMPQRYTSEFRKKIVCLHTEEGVPAKASLLSRGYPKPAFPSGAVNLAENAKQKPLKIQILQTKWSL